MTFQSLRRIVSNDLAIDLGTASTLVVVRGRGIVINEPSVVAVNAWDHSVVAVGREAKAMLGRTHASVSAVRPLRDGVIADVDITEKMLHHLITRAIHRRAVMRPHILVAVPSGITQVERRAVRDAAMRAGAHAVHLLDEPTAAALGAGLHIDEPGGHLIVDIGGGTTEVAVLSLSGTVYSQSVRGAGDEMDEAIVQHVKKQRNLLIGERTAETVKLALGSALPTPERRTLTVKGRDLIDGIPKSVVVTDEEIREALREPVFRIVDAVHTCLERTPPELAADFIDKGITLTGGGALLPGLDQLLHQETGLPVSVAPDPTSCVALGAAKLLDQLPLLKRVALATF